ncbi:P44/Msp2 family outer membrane protein [Hyphococcus sp. DH-69]|uniref:P44/Msp2 family outer membrane protein n=1 Tax=Hyphococcus formosus TaxID=3143534 RepID=UPI00398B5DB6
MNRVKVLSATLFIAAASLNSPTVLAQEPAKDGPYVRFGAGINFANDWSQDYSYNPDATFVTPPPTGQMVENGEGLVAAFALGFDYADGIRTELEYRYASTKIDGYSVIDPVAGPTPTTPVNDDIVAHLLMSNFYFDYTNQSPLTPFIGGGVGGAFLEDASANRDAALAYQGRAGVAYAIGGGFSADVEYIYLRTNKLVFGVDEDDFVAGGPAGPSINGDRYETSSVMLSLRKQF